MKIDMGVIYMTWGEKAITEADRSMASLWRCMPSMPVLAVGDKEAQAHYRKKSHVTFALVAVDPFQEGGSRGFQFMAGRIKPLLAALSPFERSLYVDADTLFQTSPKAGFALLDRWDFVVAEAETRSLKHGMIGGEHETRGTVALLHGAAHLLFHNSGMLFWRRNEATAKLFQLWAEEWLRFKGWDEQVALLRALLRSDVVFLTVPYTWNCREGRKAVFVHHRFGTRAARKLRAGCERGPVMVRGVVIMSRVEIGPGRFVRCRPGEEQAVKRRFELQMMRHVKKTEMAK